MPPKILYGIPILRNLSSNSLVWKIALTRIAMLLYEYLIFEDIEKFNGEIFNAGLQNLKIIEISDIVRKVVEDKLNKKIEVSRMN